jgi:hypothetical protein
VRRWLRRRIRPRRGIHPSEAFEVPWFPDEDDHDQEFWALAVGNKDS